MKSKDEIKRFFQYVLFLIIIIVVAIAYYPAVTAVIP